MIMLRCRKAREMFSHEQMRQTRVMALFVAQAVAAEIVAREIVAFQGSKIEALSL